ncbi:MAG: 50S ribosomal protein L11 methyltransferase, partial [Anaerolineaceae bacterium]|nr:50S ribosomal protein L11 methyltransferase [Anaerolineaceae bacterium]
YIEPGQTIIDVGCGSGILSIAALKLGASHALCVDVDKASVISTGKNAYNNNVEEFIECDLGSVQEILEGDFSIRHAPVVAVNIIAPIILQLFDAGLAELVEKTGKLLLSGILEEQSAEIEDAAQKSGMKLIHKLQQEDWISLAYEK